MRISHVNITIPRGAEPQARAFYTELLGLKEIPKPEAIRSRGGLWYDVGGSDLHLSIEENRAVADAYRHFGLEMEEVEGVRKRLVDAGVAIDPGRAAPWKRFFVHDPFGNRLEIHEVGGLRA
jgi:catechol 2,3-dioxygenase-like lactoylglutathione lyase family enzyme